MKARVVKPVTAFSITIRAQDDAFAVTSKHRPFKRPVFFTRALNGDIGVIWRDPAVEVISLGSAKDRHALWRKAEAKATREATKKMRLARRSR